MDETIPWKRRRHLSGPKACALFLLGLATMKVGLWIQIPLVAIGGAIAAGAAGAGFILRQKTETDGSTERSGDWFGVGRRKVLVLAMLAVCAVGWVGMQLHWIKARHAAIEWVKSQATHKVTDGQSISYRISSSMGKFKVDTPWADVDAPLGLRLFGEPGVALVSVKVFDDDPDAKQQTSRLTGLFPEATVHVEAVANPAKVSDGG